MLISSNPKARSENLVIQELTDETLVFDQKAHQAHCLNKLAAMVWRHCDGQRTKEELTGIVGQQLAVPADTQLVELALEELAQAKLLEGFDPASLEQKQYTRRDLARHLGVGAAAALLLTPLVASVSSAKPAEKHSPPPATISDRNLKDNFAEVDAHAVLTRLAKLPITTWNYNFENPTVRHIGPMAQDFAAAFAVGTDDRHIHGGDASGVAFAAIQALYDLVRHNEEVIEALRTEVDELRQRVPEIDSQPVQMV